MREQFDLFHVESPTTVDIVCILSAGLYANMDVVVVVPLLEGPPRPAAPPIHTEVTVNGKAHTAKLELIASIEASILGQKIGTARQYEYQIKNALDRLIAGY